MLPLAGALNPHSLGRLCGQSPGLKNVARGVHVGVVLVAARAALERRLIVPAFAIHDAALGARLARVCSAPPVSRRLGLLGLVLELDLAVVLGHPGARGLGVAKHDLKKRAIVVTDRDPVSPVITTEHG